MSVIKVEDIAYVRFSAPNLFDMRGFLEDFGFVCEEYSDGRLYARGRDGGPFHHVTELGEPRFIGLGLRASGIDELQLLASFEQLPIEQNFAPGGGNVVRLIDPDGFVVEVVAEQKRRSTEVGFGDRATNTVELSSRIGRHTPLKPGPSHIQRIGHCGLGVSDFRRSEEWYKDRFGFISSDEVEDNSGERIGAFLRCDLGSKPVDHHTLVLRQLPKGPRFFHAAFEVANLDDLMLGHTHLKSRDRTHVWGVGRHVVGNQVFDYWRDPWGNEFEHWTDGDLLTVEEPTNKASLSEFIGTEWGLPRPSSRDTNRGKQ